MSLRVQPEPEEKPLPPARRRRRQRGLTPLTSDERTALADALARRAVPTVEFFALLVLAALVWVLGLWWDAPALWVLGALVAPTLGPLAGLSLGVATGSWGYFSRMALTLTVGTGLVFLSGVLGGVVALAFPRAGTHLATLAQMSGPSFLLLGTTAIWHAWSTAREHPSRRLASVGLSYTILLPLMTAGFGLSAGVEGLWPDGLLVFAVHLTWAGLLGALTLARLGFRPNSVLGYSVGTALLLAAALLLLSGLGLGAALGTHTALPLPPTATPSPPPPPPTATYTPLPSATPTPPPPTATPSPTPTQSPTPTLTPSPSPTPVYAYVNAPEKYGGVVIREAPGFDQKRIGGALNGTLVVVLVEGYELDGHIWAKIYVPSLDLTGWVIQDLLLVATPAPRW